MSTLESACAERALPRRRRARGLWRRARRNTLSLVALAVVAALTLVALGAPWLAPYDPDAPDAGAALQAPGLRHWLGTDIYGRDQLSRIIHASRVDLLVALAATAIALSSGVVLGALSGYRGGWTDQLLMRAVDTIQAFPSFILAMGITAALGNSTANVVVAIAITHVPIYTRLIRGEMLRVRELEYAEAARTVGNRERRIVFYHLLPNCFPPVIVQATLAMGFAILTVAALSFIGLGIQPPMSEWGAMTAEGAGYIVSGEWWLFLFPGLAIMVTVLSFNLVGDTLRDVLDPRISPEAGGGQSAGTSTAPAEPPSRIALARPALAGGHDGAAGELLGVEDLTVHFDTGDGPVEAVDGASFSIRPGEIFGLVGESGSGKSVTALTILRLLPPPARIVGGRVELEGRDLLALDEDAMRRVRGARISMVFQSPRTSLNPVLPVGAQLERLIRLHGGASASEARERALAMLRESGLSEVERRAAQYPHQLSGGMCQRVMIAMALATSPRLLIADEPTTGLDVSIAAQILDLLRDLGRRTGASILLITHDLGVVAGLCDRVAVMHAGQIVEWADVRRLFTAPAHPYTRALLRAVPRVDRELTMEPIPGAVPALLAPPPGCRFAPRCPHAMPECRRERPAAVALEPGHQVACLAVAPSREHAPRG